MKTRILSLCVCMLLSIVSMNAEIFDKKNTVTYNVSMRCGNCANRIQTNLPKEKGVTKVTVDLANKLVTVDFNETTTAANIKAALTKMGFTATPANAKAKANMGAKKSCCKGKMGQGKKNCCCKGKMKQGAKKSCCKGK